MEAMKQFQMVAAIVAGAIVAVGFLVWYVVRRQRQA